MMVILVMKCVSLFSPIRSVGAPCESRKMSTFSKSVDLGYTYVKLYPSSIPFMIEMMMFLVLSMVNFTDDLNADVLTCRGAGT